MDDRLRLVTAPPPLKIHDLFADVHWSQVIFLTYSFDLPFFESYLLPKLLRNGPCAIAVAADAGQLAENLPSWIEAGEVREAGRSYILCGAHVPGAFHPKLMLAANEQVGTVLLGSGNLSTFGMTTGGELFTYETWGAAAIPPLARQAWALCRQLGHRIPIDPLFAEHVETMGRHIPQLALPADGPLLHNLDQPLLDQFVQSLGNRRVREVLLWAPFTDRRLGALQAIVERCQPQTVTLALQPEHTCLDGARLRELVAAYRDVDWNFVELHQQGNGLIHAKGILATLANGEEWLLAGSPNLSTPALLKTNADGNFELARCIRGHNLRTTLFSDDGPVSLGGVLVPDSLCWDEQPGMVSSPDELDPLVQLLGATWDGRTLRLIVRGIVPPEAQALIDNKVLLPIAHLQDGVAVQEVGDLIPTSVALHWNSSRTVPVIVSNLRLLKAVVGSAQAASLVPLEALDYGDEGEIIQLLEQLAQMTITTRHDIARMMRGGGPATERDEGQEAESQALPVDLSDIDFSRVRQHPRASVYDQQRAGSFDAPNIQLWLDEIVRQFDILRERQLRLVTTPVASEDDEMDDDVAPTLRRRWAISRRIRVRIRNRVRRYILGLGDPGFLRLVGPDWMAINYSLFLQVLHTLWERLQDPSTAILSLEDLAGLTADMLADFWGCDDRTGYWMRRSEDEAVEVGLHLLDRHSDGLTLAMAERLLTLSHAQRQQAPFIVAGVARALMSVGLLTDAAAEQALVYLGRPDEDPRRLQARIVATITYFTWHRFCDVLTKRHRVSRVSLRGDMFNQGDTLVVNDKAPLDAHPGALALFSAWIAEEQRQKPLRRIFQMLWNTEENVLIYNRLNRDLVWRRTSPEGRREFVTIAEAVDPTTFASWATLSPPTSAEVRKTGQAAAR